MKPAVGFYSYTERCVSAKGEQCKSNYNVSSGW